MKEYINELIHDIERKIEDCELDIEDYQRWDNPYFERKIEICRNKLEILHNLKDYLNEMFHQEKKCGIKRS